MYSNVVRYIQRLSDIVRDGRRKAEKVGESKRMSEIARDSKVSTDFGPIIRYGKKLRYSRICSKIVTDKNSFR